jgi:hypothetical protein
MSSEPMDYLLFPYTILPEKEHYLLSILLPRLSLLQVVRLPVIPTRLQGQITGLSAITDPGQLQNVELCLKGYQQFATVHGENSVLASLSLEQISNDFAESRFRIRTQLKKGDSEESHDRETALAEAAIFLEMARDLDEKEMELEVGLTEIDGLEGEFREILGISDEDDWADVIDILNPALRAEKAYLSFMLPKRIESWLRLFLKRKSPACPTTLVTTSQAVVEELFDPVRVEYERAGKSFEPGRVLLGSIPSLEDYSLEEFVNLVSSPEASTRFDSFRLSLDKMLRVPDDPGCREQMSLAADTLQDFLRDHRRALDLSEGSEVHMELIFDSSVRWGNLGKYYQRLGQSQTLRDASPPDEIVKVLLCRF